jgi:hypothetical protein
MVIDDGMDLGGNLGMRKLPGSREFVVIDEEELQGLTTGSATIQHLILEEQVIDAQIKAGEQGLKFAAHGDHSLVGAVDEGDEGLASVRLLDIG